MSYYKIFERRATSEKCSLSFMASHRLPSDAVWEETIVSARQSNIGGPWHAEMQGWV
jgi:hypothetical protein